MSKHGVFAYLSDADVEDWQSSIDIVLRRFAEYHDLEGVLVGAAHNVLRQISHDPKLDRDHAQTLRSDSA